MLSSFISVIEKQSLLKKGEKILAAVSGGKDSMVMLHLLCSAGFNVGVAHINYQLRGSDSDEDADLVKSTCKQLNVPFHIQKADIEKGKTNIQEAARTIRYNFFDALCIEHDYQKIATAHHANDALETLFIQLMRGTGIHGLKAIPVKRGNIIRPLLWASREEIDAYAEHEKISFRNDVSNASDHYLRNRIRHHLLPLIDQKIDPTAIQKLKSSINMLTEDGAAVQSMANSLLKQTDNNWTINLAELPANSAHTWVYHAISKFGFNRVHAQNICTSIENKKQVLSNNFCCTKDGDLLIIERIKAALALIEINKPGKYQFGSISLSLKIKPLEKHQNPLDFIPNQNIYATFDADLVSFPVTFGPLSSTESMQPLGSKHNVKLKKLISSSNNNASGLKNAAGEILWLYKERISEKAKISVKTKTVLIIETAEIPLADDK